MVTAYSNFMLEAFRNAAFDYLIKPVDGLELEHVIRRYRENKIRTVGQERVEALQQYMKRIIRIPSVYETWFFEPDQIVCFEGDGNSDRIFFGLNQIGHVFTKIYDPGHRGQFNTDGEFPQGPFVPFFTDINRDGTSEILLFTQKDSADVFLNIIDYKADSVYEKIICTAGIPGKRDYSAWFTHFADLDNDGERGIQTATAETARQSDAFFSGWKFFSNTTRSQPDQI